MMRTALATLGLIGLATFAGCSKDKASDKPLETTQNETSNVNNAAPLPAVANNRPTQTGEAAFVVSVTAVRRANNEEKQIDDPAKPGKKVNNYITTLHRGEQVSVLKVDGDWAQVRSSDEKEGWLKKDSLLPSEGITMATTLEETKTFDRPDLLALNAKRKVSTGALVYSMRAKDQFSEVNLGGTSTAWVLTSALVSDPREVDAAKILNKARYLSDRKDASASDLMELAKKEYGDTKLMQAVASAPEAPSEGAPTPSTPPAGEPQAPPPTPNP